MRRKKFTFSVRQKVDKENVGIAFIMKIKWKMGRQCVYWEMKSLERLL